MELKKDAKKDALKPRYAQIVVDIPAQEVNRAFQYLVPDTLRGKIEIGSAVIVPFHHTRRVGYVVGFSSEPQVPKISSLAGMVDENPFFDEEMVSLCSWIGSYYFSTTGESLRLAFPPGRGRRLYQEISLVKGQESHLRQGFGRQARVKSQEFSDGTKVLLKQLDEAGGNLPLKELLKSWGKRIFFLLKELEAKSFIEKRYRLSLPQVNALEEKYAKLNRSPEDILKTVSSLTIRAPKQEKILQILLENSSMPVSELLASSGAASSSLNSLVKKGLVSIFFKSAYRKPDFFYPEPPSVISSLTTEQSDSVQGIKEALKREEFSSFLLQGVTGSGKTEVYLRAIDYVLKLKKSAIVLVPEIALTPQTVHRFQERFGQIFPEEGQPPGKIAVLHSGLSLGERYDQWRGIKEGRYKVVV
ncbi:MAG TPA: DEAD/DEAH box helicase family protein, partial [Candidatus Subteraquimicrobiales bacterium]